MKYISYAIKDSKTKIEEYAENISLKAALESIILLKNDNNTLPLNNKNIDLFGNGSRHTIKGGSGSGEVNEIGVKSIYASLIDEGFTISSKAWLDDYDLEYSKELEKYKKDIHKSIYKFDFINFMGKRINFIPSHEILKSLVISSPEEETHKQKY